MSNEENYQNTLLKALRAANSHQSPEDAFNDLLKEFFSIIARAIINTTICQEALLAYQ